MLPVKGAKASVAGAEGTGIELLKSPYVNPSMCDDAAWLKDAFPGNGRTMITWGASLTLHVGLLQGADIDSDQSRWKGDLL